MDFKRTRLGRVSRDKTVEGFFKNGKAKLLSNKMFFFLHTVSEYPNFDVLPTVHLSIFISLFNQLDAQNLFHIMFYFIPLHVSSTCAHHRARDCHLQL